MKYLVPFLFTAFALSSCNVDDEADCPFGDLESTIHQITTQSDVLNTVVNGKRRYAWDLSVSYGISTAKEMTALSVINLNTNAVQIPVQVQVFVIINGEIEDEILVAQIDGNLTTYVYHQEFELEQYFDGCEGAASIRVQLEFDTTGSTSFDDEYLADILTTSSDLTIYWYPSTL